MNRLTPETFHIMDIQGRLRATRRRIVRRCLRELLIVFKLASAIKPSGRSAMPDGDHKSVRVEVTTRRAISR
jgi:hypothetical protein